MTAIRTRREPPPFRLVQAKRVESRTPHMVGITVAGAALDGFDPGLPAASVRLLLPTEDSALVLPTWQGNEFLLDDGSRPIIRTLTPVRFDSESRELDIEIVLHGHGPLSAWADSAQPGDAAAISGTGRGYEVDPSARTFLLAGDESALPAIGSLLGALPAEAVVEVLVEVRELEAGLELPNHPGVAIRWLVSDAAPGDSLVAAVMSASLDPDVHVWAAGEAAAMQRIRRHLSDQCGLPRSQTVIRGYWKHGRETSSSTDL